MKRDFVYILIIIILAAVGYWQFDSAQSSRAAYVSEATATKIWRDKAGKSIAEAEVIKSDFSLFKQTHKSLVDSLKKELGTAKVKSVVTVTRTITDTVSVTLDSRGLLSYKDRWTRITQPGPGSLVYSIYDSLSVSTYNKHYGFLNLKSRYVTNITNSNPHVVMTGARSYEISPAERRIGLGFFTGPAITGSGLGWGVGFGVTYRLF